MHDLRDLLYQALEAFEAEGPDGLEAFYAVHPSEATELRSRVRELREAGLLEEAPASDLLTRMLDELAALEGRAQALTAASLAQLIEALRRLG